MSQNDKLKNHYFISYKICVVVGVYTVWYVPATNVTVNWMKTGARLWSCTSMYGHCVGPHGTNIATMAVPESRIGEWH